MGKPLDELYFVWLYNQVGSGKDPDDPSENYWDLLRIFYSKEFAWIVPNDDNRAQDGLDLRLEFLETKSVDKSHDPHWMRFGCSMLELFIGLSRRLSFEGEGEATDWFWELVNNLGLDEFNDTVPIPEELVDEILDQVIWRKYTRTGRGGLFPLVNAKEDQREIELWYQLSAYLLERV